ncbi:MAG: isoprenoid biosynthesis glyoxalase ElbB [Bacteroidales bacterium]|nr:isoprenoid biosynthesis glyoxalase ElbB [Bacteroidales bacterium]
MKTKKFAVVLAGNGVFDGAEIHEATMTLYAIAKNNAQYEIFAPDINQHHVINHITGEEMNETRNVLIEAARIARGKISPLSDFSADIFDAIVFPGGFGVAKNLSDFAFKGSECSVNEQVEQVIIAMHKQKKPIGALCISPVIIAKVLKGVNVTIGQDADTATQIQNMGSSHSNTNHGEVTVDEQNNVFTTPCYMLNATIVNIADGAMNVVSKMLEYM